jgi:hypothetical protein
MNEKPLCNYHQCPKKDTCKHFREVLAHWQKKQFLWWGAYPYEVRKGNCYDPIPVDPKNDN